MRTRSIVVVLATAALAGCGGAGGSSGDFEGVESDIAEVIERLETLGTRQDSAGEICRDLLTTALAQRLAGDGGSCEREIRQAIADSDFSQLGVTDITVRGEAATARVESSAGEVRRQATVELARERGDWRVSTIRSAR